MAKKAKTKQESVVEASPTPEVPRVDFHVWFALREKRIPQHHMREILWADFKGQGLSAKETMETYDQALETYGIKL